MNKSDSKYFHTALLMNEALLLLLEKKEFEFITVKEVCEKAGVHRTTFYLHYNDMNDLLKELTKNFTLLLIIKSLMLRLHLKKILILSQRSI